MSDRPSFGIILSLIAIMLILNALSTLNGMVQVLSNDGGLEGNEWLMLVDGIALVWVLACLGMLLARRHLFIYLFGSLLLFNLATNAYLFWSGALDMAPGVAAIALVGQSAIAIAWLAYLALSQHLREVCCD